MAELLRLEHVSKSFPLPSGEGRLDILCDISFALSEGEAIAIVGKSGSGKSTLLSVAALLQSKDGGSIIYGGRDCSGLSAREVTALRSSSMGFIFQDSMLLEDFTALENAAIPLMIKGWKRRDAFKEAEAMLESLSLGDRAGHRPRELSGGEKQRVAIARALISSPSIVFADEPTGALDEKTELEIESIILDRARSAGRGLLLVTHNPDFASKADRRLVLADGRLIDG